MWFYSPKSKIRFFAFLFLHDVRCFCCLIWTQISWKQTHQEIFHVVFLLIYILLEADVGIDKECSKQVIKGRFIVKNVNQNLSKYHQNARYLKRTVPFIRFYSFREFCVFFSKSCFDFIFTRCETFHRFKSATNFAWHRNGLCWRQIK